MADTNALLDVIEAERARHPRMDERDLQKLIYQSVFGGDHLLVDPERYGRAFREEWNRLPVDDAWAFEPALQTIDPEGRVARIHLSACKRSGVEVDRLIELLVGQRRRNGRRPDFERRWDETIALARSGRIPFSVDALERVGYPDRAPRHGPDYGPASYRIVNDAADPAMVERLRRLGVRR
jgi:hypothetical protein